MKSIARGTPEDPALLCVSGAVDAAAVAATVGLRVRAVVVDLDMLTLAELTAQTLHEPGHIVLGVAGWGTLRHVLPLTRSMTALRLTVVIQRVRDPWRPTAPWEPVLVGKRDGARLQLQSRSPMRVHAVLTRYLADGPVGTRIPPAHGLRVGLYGRGGEPWVAGDVNALHLERRGWAAALEDDVAPLGDVVLAARSDAGHIADLPGAPPVVSVDVGWEPGRGTVGPQWSSMATAHRADVLWPRSIERVGTRRVIEISPLPPIDTGSVNPVGFLNAGVDGYATVGPGEDGDTVRLTGPRGTAVEVAHGGSLGPEQIAALRRVRGVRDRSTVHRGPLEHARLLSQLAAAGVPLLVEALPEAVRALLGPELSRLLPTAKEPLLGDDFWREAHSIALRRVALRQHSARARWAEVAGSLPYRPARRPTISVVLATRRPQQLVHALHQVELQRDVTAEVVVALHGEHFDLDEAQRIADATRVPVEIVHAPSQEVFGDVLNQATERCQGDLVAKMDDDDWYGPYHLWDLLAAMEYTGATIVGRPAEFVHLASIDVTIRRISQGCERVADQVPGGGLIIGREDLRDVGGWRPIPRAIDRFVCRQVREAGGTVYRTHGFGFLVSRHDEGHTWDSTVNRFLRSSVRQWRGARLDMATADLLPPERHPRPHVPVPLPSVAASVRA